MTIGLEVRIPVRQAIAFGLAVVAASAASHAVVITDGSLGPRRSLTGSDVALRADLGRQRGGNVFQSFAQLDVPAGGSVTFTADGATQPVHNVLARVTGGRTSRIDGTLGTSIAGANLYLINPAGVVFGAGGRLNVSGTFTATTADVVRLADGKNFAVDRVGDGVLTAAAPGGFGFLAARPGAITVASGAVLTAPSARLVAGGVGIGAAKITTPGGHLSVAAVTRGEVTVDAASGDLAPSPAATGGTVALARATLATDADSGGGRLDVHGAAVELFDSQLTADSGHAGVTFAGAGTPGAVVVDAGTLSMTHASAIAANALDNASAGSVTIAAGKMLVSGGSSVGSDAFGAGRGGAVVVTARRLTVDGNNVNDGSTRIGSDDSPAHAQTPATGGSVSVTARVLTLLDGGRIGSDAVSSGAAGDVNISADTLTLDGGSSGVPATINSNADVFFLDATGAAGTVTVEADTVNLFNGSSIAASTNGRGAAGDVTVKSRVLTIDGGGRKTGIFTNANASGDAGNISITARRTLLLRDRGEIDATSIGSGRAGTVSVTGGRVTLDADNLPGLFTGITSEAETNGPGGDVTIRAASLSIVRGARISADTVSPLPGGTVTVTVDDALSLSGGGQIASSAIEEGKAGSVTVHANTLSMNGTDSVVTSTAIASNATASAHGAAGDVSVHANDIRLTNGALIRSDNNGHGNGGSVDVSGQRLLLDSGAQLTVSSHRRTAGDVTVTMADAIRTDHATVSAASPHGDGGSVHLTAGRTIAVDHSLVTAFAAGDGGRLTLDPLHVLLNASTLNAISGGRAANVTIDPAALLVKSVDTRILLNGTPTLPPDVDLTGALLHFVVPVLGQQAVLAQGCEAQMRHRHLSSFTTQERLGMPPAPGAAVASPGARLPAGSD